MISNPFKKYDVLSEIKRGIGRLNKREKRLLFGALLLTAFVLLDLVLITPLYRSSRRLEKEVKADRAGLVEMQQLSDQHKKYALLLRGNESVPKNFSIMTYLENVANAAGVSYDSLQPRTAADTGTSYIDVRIKGISLYQLTTLLFKIEIGGQYQLKIKRLNARVSYNNPSLLDISIQVVVPGSANE